MLSAGPFCPQGRGLPPLLGAPWLSAHQCVKCFPRESPGKPPPAPAVEYIKEEAFLPASSAGVRPRVTLQLGQEASH